MASRDYDDLLESFMNNSAKVYNEDKENLSSEENKVPSSYNLDKTSKRILNLLKEAELLKKERISRVLLKKVYSKDSRQALKFLEF